ncbi:MAG: two-component system LytT family response regulator [Flavobacteriales bacterium]|jgi:two-component system LytT family response regulator
MMKETAQCAETLRTLIVDDEPLAIEGLRLRLNKIPNIELVGECNNGDEAILMAQKIKPDLIFLDLEMPGLSGFEVVQALQSDDMPMVVFVTAYQAHAVKAFELHAVDYILKPADLERLQHAVSKALDRKISMHLNADKQKLLKALSDLSNSPIAKVEEWLDSDSLSNGLPADSIAITNPGHSTIILPVNDIRWIDAAGDYMCLHTASETHILRTTLKKLEASLNPVNFQRVHKSTIVNVHCIKEVRAQGNNDCVLVLCDDTTVKLSRNYRDALKHIPALAL